MDIKPLKVLQFNLSVFLDVFLNTPASLHFHSERIDLLLLVFSFFNVNVQHNNAFSEISLRETHVFSP